MGDTSYAIYLFQVPVLCATAAHFQIMLGDSAASGVKYFMLSFAILVAGSVLLTRRANQVRGWLFGKLTSVQFTAQKR